MLTWMGLHFMYLLMHAITLALHLLSDAAFTLSFYKNYDGGWMPLLGPADVDRELDG